MASRAGFWIRLLAAAIDAVALVVLFMGAGIIAIAFVFGGGGPVSADDEDRVIVPLVYGIAWLYTSFEIWTAGTPGKLLLRLRIREQDGSPAHVWRRVLRWSTKQFGLIFATLGVASGLPVFVLVAGFANFIVFVGCFFAANDDRLTWHDQWAHTAVYHLPRTGQSFQVITPPPPLPAAKS